MPPEQLTRPSRGSDSVPKRDPGLGSPDSDPTGSPAGPAPPNGPLSTPDRAAAPTDLARYGKFLLVGFTGVFVNIAVFVVTVDALGGRPFSNFYTSVLHFATKSAANPELDLIGSAVAFGAATLWNYFFNNLWTFRTEADRRHSPTRRLGLYFGVSLGSLGVNEVVLLATEALISPLFGQGLGILAGSIVGFLGNSRFTFAEAARS
jgi:putative flippase GtrA